MPRDQGPWLSAHSHDIGDIVGLDEYLAKLKSEKPPEPPEPPERKPEEPKESKEPDKPGKTKKRG